MANTYDVIVAGVGAMGSAACWQLARRGFRVLGLERFAIPHNRGSSHGVTRIIRLAYYEHPDYVPLLRRAYELWRETERKSGQQLLFITGGIDAGRPDSRLVTGSLLSCRTHALAHEVLDAKELQRRFPGFNLPADFIAVYQPDGGFVACERAIVAQVELARAAGAEIRTQELMTKWEATSGGVRVTTQRGTYEAGRLILSTGAWIADHVPALKGKAVAERQVLGWFEPKKPELFSPDVFPISILETDEGLPYALPVWGVPGFKLGLFRHLHEQGHADALPRETNAKDEALLRGIVERYFPQAAGRTLSLQTCLFTNVPDAHFVIDTLPGLPQVIVASPCSGHGFKFAGVIGEILADMATRGTPRFDLRLFSLARLAA